MAARPARDSDLFRRVTNLLGTWHDIPTEGGFGGTGGPGRLLEHLLDIKANNQDLPDAGRWEVKFSSKTSYLTLFHFDPYPRDPCVVEDLIKAAGWKSTGGMTAFRHTIWGRSKRGFRVETGHDRVTVKHDGHPGLEPYWDIDDLINASATKLRNLILVFGETRSIGVTRQAKYNTAHAYAKFRFKDFLKGLDEGWICVDFDARTKPNGAIRNHGTKFRIRHRDMNRMYAEHAELDAERGGTIQNPRTASQSKAGRRRRIRSA